MTRSLAALVLLCGTAVAGDLRIVDGDSIVLDGQRIRLFGVDAPERNQTCQGHDGSVYECGRDATTVLRELTANRTVTCTPRDRDRYGRIVAVCTADGKDIGAEMVRRGWATDYARYSHGAYAVQERAARDEGLGMWSGRFTMPAEWRKEHRR